MRTLCGFGGYQGTLQQSVGIPAVSGRFSPGIGWQLRRFAARYTQGGFPDCDHHLLRWRSAVAPGAASASIVHYLFSTPVVEC